MRWSIIRLIWLRELRDQLRDRRTIFMIVVLPIFLYPVLGIGVLQFALGFMGNPTVGIVGSDALPQPSPRTAGMNPGRVCSWLTTAPDGGVDRIIGAYALFQVAPTALGQEFPPLLSKEDDLVRFQPGLFESAKDADKITIKTLPDSPPQELTDLLDNRGVDLVIVVPADFRDQLRAGGRPTLEILTREGDDRSRLIGLRVRSILNKWKQGLKQVRLLQYGLPASFDDPVELKDPTQAEQTPKQITEGLGDMLARVFPVLLVMWSLTGALYPAVDLCAGEKERGTMETLLISPAGREEIVYGKFLTIWVFSAVTTLLNLGSIGFTTFYFSGVLSTGVLKPASLMWCALLLLPLSAFFSAVCLALGAYARSSKEGQYYLMPLFLVTMPLVFLTLAPGVELTPLYSLVPVTGVALLLQRLMTLPSVGEIPWIYFVPVLAPTVLYGWLALRWAILQFQREEVLFREAERLDIGLWLKHLFRDKEPLPTVGEAMFCFALITGLRWLSMGFGSKWDLLLHTAIDLVAFVITPPILMALLLTSRPLAGLQLRLPPWRSILTATLLAVSLAVPLVELAGYWVPKLEPVLSVNDQLAKKLFGYLRGEGDLTTWWRDFLVLAVMAAICQEVAFRGFILSGLLRRFKPWTAILLSSFLFALSHLNVFQFIPMFFLGVILALMATRSGSIVPGMVFHVVHNTLILALLMLARSLGDWTAVFPPLVRSGFVVLCAGGAIMYLLVSGYRLWAFGPMVHPDESPGIVGGAGKRFLDK